MMSKVKLSRDHVLKGLEDLRDQELLCDVHLVAEGAKFPAHRVVLAAASPYFQAMFTGGFKENQMSEITLNDTSSKGLESVLDAIYTGELLLLEENVCDVLPVASLLQLSEIVKHCEDFLIAKVSADNCLSFLAAGEKYDLQEAVDSCNKFIMENFDTFSQMAEFTNLSKEKLYNCLSNDQLKTSHGEINVFRGALKWFEANPGANADRDSSDLADLMQQVRFPLIPTDLLLDEIQTCRLISENNQVMKMVSEALRFHSHDKVFLQPLKEGKQFQPRGEQKLALIKTFSNPGPNRAYETKLHLINVTGDSPFHTQFSEHQVPRTFSLSAFSHSVVAKGNYLFIFGTDPDSKKIVAVRFDVKRNVWLDLDTPPLDTPPSGGFLLGVAITLLKDSIYLLGGVHATRDSQNAVQRKVLPCALQYSVETNSWARLANLPRPLGGHAAASQGNYVFSAGGFTQDRKVTDKLYAFDVVGKIWLAKASMEEKRANFSLETLGAKLVACGGSVSPNVEIYDIANDQWTLVQNEVLEHYMSPATVVKDGKVYVIGGDATDEDGTRVSTDDVSCVDVDNGTVHRVSNLPFKVKNHACALLTVPHRAAGPDSSQNDN